MTDASIRAFLLPDLGEGLETAEIMSWSVAPGDTIELNQVICTVETAKAEVEVPSPFAGVVVERHGEEGDQVPVGSVLVRIAVGDAAPTPPTEPVLVGYGTSPSEGHGRRRRARRSRPSASGPRVRAKPRVRRAARELGIDLASLAPGSGPDGAITHDDLERTRNPSAPARIVPIGPGDTIPLSGIRRTIADRMTASRRIIPDANCGLWIDATRLVRRRDELQTAAGPGVRVTPLVMILRLTVDALRAWPIINATLDDATSTIHVLDDIHLGLATATDHGLLVPVIDDAPHRTVVDLAAEVARLSDGARDRSLAPSELLGSTFTVTNYGALGVDDGIPVINHPEAAILGVGAIRTRPWVVDGALSVRHVAKLTCAFDHRICDGAEAAGFLRTLGELIEAADVELGGRE